MKVRLATRDCRAARSEDTGSWLLSPVGSQEPAYAMCYMELARGGALRAPFEPPVLRRRQGRLVDGLGPRDMLAVVPLGEPRRE